MTKYSTSSKPTRKRLKRIDDGWVAGVCAGFAYYFGTSAWIIRLPIVLSLFLPLDSFALIVTYAILWLLMPEYDEIPKDYHDISG